MTCSSHSLCDLLNRQEAWGQAICHTGELTHTDYSDSTTDITTTHTRLGQKKTVTDATGTRTFAYSANTLQPETETIDVYLVPIHTC